MIPTAVANNKTFNKMHNHATWATAAVGMIGFAMNREDYVNKALYGSAFPLPGGKVISAYDCGTD